MTSKIKGIVITKRGGAEAMLVVEPFDTIKLVLIEPIGRYGFNDQVDVNDLFDHVTKDLESKIKSLESDLSEAEESAEKNEDKWHDELRRSDALEKKVAELEEKLRQSGVPHE